MLDVVNKTLLLRPSIPVTSPLPNNLLITVGSHIGRLNLCITILQLFIILEIELLE